MTNKYTKLITNSNSYSKVAIKNYYLQTSLILGTLTYINL